MNKVHNFQPIYFIFVLILLYFLRLSFPDGLLPSGSLMESYFLIFIVLGMHSICLASLVQLCLIIVIMSGEKCHLMSSSLWRSRVSSVGITTRYGLEGPGIETRWGARAALASNQPPIQWVPGLTRV